MKLRRLSTVFFMAVALAGACLHADRGWAQGSLLPSQESVSRLGLERVWWGQATINPQRDKIAHFTMDEDNVYVQATSGVTTAFDAEDGRKLWSVQLGRFDSPSYPVVANEELAMVVVGTQMYALEKFSGKTRWQIRLPGAPSTAPAVDDERVYVGTLDGSVYAYSIAKIRQLYERQMLPQWSGEALLWRYQSALEVTSPPIPSGRLLHFASRSGSLYSINPRTTKLAYQFETDGAIVAPVVRQGRVLLIASEDFTFYAINAENGSVIWDFSSGLPIRRSPYSVGNDLFLMPDRGGMYSLSLRSGVQNWWRPNITGFVAIAAGNAFVTDSDLNLLALNRSDGSVVSGLPMRQFPIRIANDRTDRIYLATPAGLVVALRPKNRSFPLFHKYPDRLPILPEFAPEEGEAEAAPAEMPADAPAAELQ